MTNEKTVEEEPAEEDELVEDDEGDYFFLNFIWGGNIPKRTTVCIHQWISSCLETFTSPAQLKFKFCSHNQSLNFDHTHEWILLTLSILQRIFGKSIVHHMFFLFSAETEIGEENDVEKRSGGKQTIFIYFYV